MPFNFRKNEKLKSEKEINLLFNNGISIFNHPLRVIYLFSTTTDASECKILISVPKRLHKNAIDRNILKRRLREAYRLNSLTLKENLIKNMLSAKIAFIYSSSKSLSYKEIEEVVLKQISYIINKIPQREEII